jgi:hypothetical protein
MAAPCMHALLVHAHMTRMLDMHAAMPTHCKPTLHPCLHHLKAPTSVSPASKLTFISNVSRPFLFVCPARTNQPSVSACQDQSTVIVLPDQVANMGGGESLIIDTLGRWLRPAYAQRIAYHEAGHFLIAYLVGFMPRAYTLSSLDAFMRCDELAEQLHTTGRKTRSYQ